MLAVAGLIIKATIPRGIRNNPGNIRNNHIQWHGMSLIQNDPEFVRFNHPKYGFRAMAKILKSHQARGLTTIRQIISTYAPSTENNTQAYINSVSRRLNTNSDQPLDVKSKMLDLLKAINAHENGTVYSRFYANSMIKEGISLS